MNQYKRIFSIGLAVISLAGCTFQSAPNAPPVSSEPKDTEETIRTNSASEAVMQNIPLPDWSLRERDSSILGAMHSIPPFEIRLPASFRFIKSIENTETRRVSHYWVGPIRNDETYAQFIVTFVDLSARDSKAPLLNLFDAVLTGIEARRQEWSATAPEQGIINGLPFVRCSWSGVVSSAAREGLAGRTMHGILYVLSLIHI